MNNNFELISINRNIQQEIQRVINCNEIINRYGLKLNQKDVTEIIEKKIEALKQTMRIELGESIIDKLVLKFCDSSYVCQENFKNILYDLLDIFYYYKNETQDLISDDDLIAFMRKYYDKLAHGDLDYLSGTILDKMKNNILNNKPLEDDLDIKERREDYNEF